MKRNLLCLLALLCIACKHTPSSLPKRPQDPVTFTYKQEEVTFTNPKAGDRLAGTLTMPLTGKVSKIVILITGSGPQNRNEEANQINHRPFLVLSDWLTRNGIAVLRYDDRGVGKSTGVFVTGTTADFADDAEAAVSYVRSRPDLKGLSIGLIGHSEGGIIAPMVASRDNDVNFICLLAGPGVPLQQVMVRAAKDRIRLEGGSENQALETYQNHPKVTQLIKLLELIGDASEGFCDPLGELYQQSISSGHNGQYWTPEPICDMMSLISAATLKDGEKVLDPACGSGRMLLAAGKHNRYARFYGADLDITCCKMALLNMLLNSLTVK